MIKNQKQATSTKSKILELQKELEKFEKNNPDKNSALYELGANAFNGLIKDLQNQIDEYDSLVKGNFHCIHPQSLKDVAHALIAARLAKDISQKKLAELIGIKEQQVQRYEAEDYDSASYNRIIEVAEALKLKFYFEKIIIINTEASDDNEFQIPDDISKDDIVKLKAKIINDKCLMIS